MSTHKALGRFAVATSVLALLAGQQSIGIAAADAQDPAAVSPTQSSHARSGDNRPERSARPGIDSGSRQLHAPAPASHRSRTATTVRPARAVAPVPRIGRSTASSVVRQMPANVLGPTNTEVPAAAVTAVPPLSPTSTVSTPYGQLGQWMINKTGNIADWVGIPQDGKTILEGINIVVVDYASDDPNQAKSNLNAWMRQSGFGASAISSTGYQGVLGTTTYSQQPTGPSQAFRNAYFFLSNSHGRIFGPYPNPDGPGYVWIASLSKENLDLKNFSHGYDSFQVARAELVAGMVGAGAQDLGTVFMDNVYNVGDFSTGDANGYATVLGINSVLKTATAPRGGSKAAN